MLEGKKKISKITAITSQQLSSIIRLLMVTLSLTVCKITLPYKFFEISFPVQQVIDQLYKTLLLTLVSCEIPLNLADVTLEEQWEDRP